MSKNGTATFYFSAAFALTASRCGIFGPSGSGKSTLMHLLAGLQKPDRGSISLAGQTLFDAAAGINLQPEKRRIGVVFQHAPSLSPYECAGEICSTAGGGPQLPIGGSPRRP